MRWFFIWLILSSGPHLMTYADHIKTFPPRDLTRVFEIFAWRYTDALDLSQEDGDALKDFLIQHMEKKHKLLQQKNQLLIELSHAEKHHKKFDPEDAKKKLVLYESLIQQLGQHDTQELEGIKNILSPADVLRYLSLRRELTEMLLKY